MKHCVSYISAAINRSASRNIFLNATKMVNLARHTQQNFSSFTSCDLTSSSASSSLLGGTFCVRVMQNISTMNYTQFCTDW